MADFPQDAGVDDDTYDMDTGSVVDDPDVIDIEPIQTQAVEADPSKLTPIQRARLTQKSAPYVIELPEGGVGEFDEEGNYIPTEEEQKRLSAGSSVPSFITSLLHGGQGLTYGTSDEMAGILGNIGSIESRKQAMDRNALASLLPEGATLPPVEVPREVPYEETRDRFRDALKFTQKEQPTNAFTSNLIGSVLAPSPFKSPVTKTTPPMSVLKEGAKLGAKEGALAGAGYGEGTPFQQLMSVLGGTGAGAAGGALFSTPKALSNKMRYSAAGATPGGGRVDDLAAELVEQDVAKKAAEVNALKAASKGKGTVPVPPEVGIQISRGPIVLGKTPREQMPNMPIERSEWPPHSARAMSEMLPVGAGDTQLPASQLPEVVRQSYANRAADVANRTAGAVPVAAQMAENANKSLYNQKALQEQFGKRFEGQTPSIENLFPQGFQGSPSAQGELAGVQDAIWQKVASKAQKDLRGSSVAKGLQSNVAGVVEPRLQYLGNLLQSLSPTSERLSNMSSSANTLGKVTNLGRTGATINQAASQVPFSLLQSLLSGQKEPNQSTGTPITKESQKQMDDESAQSLKLRTSGMQKNNNQ